MMREVTQRRVSSAVISEARNVERQLVAHVPDLVVFDKNAGKIPRVHKFDGVLLFADVSGFTALTEKYTQSSEKGTDALTVTLNAYIGKIVQNILQLGGDILKFAGDAILAVWKVTKRQYLPYAISQAAKCSIAIQDKCGDQITDVGVKLRVKIAISAGKIFVTFVGNGKRTHFVMGGRPVGEVNAAEKYCAAGLIVLSPNALELSERDNIIFDPLSERFGLLRYLRHDPRKNWQEYIDLPDGKSKVVVDKNIIRVALRLVPSKQREDFIRKYVPDVVKSKVDDNQPLKFLSEMRQCSIVFINMAFDINERDRQFHEKLCQNMQRVFDAVYNSSKDMQGSVNKIFMFDKGCTFLVIYGLPGSKHEEEPAHALQASWRITQALKNKDHNLTYVSIGVTTGPVFCGVVGHEERHEYTVIGQKVNLAARLMMHYPGVVSCDRDTLEDSKLSMDLFTELPFKEMKGCPRTQVFQYQEGSQKLVGVTEIIEPEYPILGRDVEIKIFMDELITSMNDQSLGTKRRVVIFEADAGYGKSRVMKEIQWRASEKNARVVGFQLSLNHAKAPYFTVRTLLELLLGIHGKTDTSVRAKALLSATNPDDRILLSVLNDIVGVDFPQENKVSSMSVEERTKEIQRLVVKIVHNVAGTKFTLFALDDAQNIDDQSWKFITTLSKDFRALCVLAMRPFSPDRPLPSDAKQVIGHWKTMYIKLPGLPNDLIGALICQILHVSHIPFVLDKFVQERSHGVPRWCEQLLREIIKAGVISVTPLKRKHLLDHGRKYYSNVESRLITRKTSGKITYLPDTPFHEQLIKDMHCVGRLTVTEEVRSEEPISREASYQEVDENLPEKTRRKQGQSHKKVLSSWAERLSWRKSSTTLLDVSHQDKEKSKEKFADAVEDSDEFECRVKPGYDIYDFPVPVSIKAMALARLDRMKQGDQMIAKCAAVIGINFSRKMLSSVVPQYNRQKFKRGIYQLMRYRVLRCASSADDEMQNLNWKAEARITHDVVCECYPAERTDDLTDEEISARCEQLAFTNSLVRETAYDLWLKSQRQSLHEMCALYLESKINEIFTTGVTDEVLVTQFRLAKKLISRNSKFVEEEVADAPIPIEGISRMSISLRTSRRTVAKPKSRQQFMKPVAEETTTVNNTSLDPALRDSKGRRTSSSVIGRINMERVGAHKMMSKPLDLKDEDMPDDFVSPDDEKEVAIFLAQAKAMNIKITKTVVPFNNSSHLALDNVRSEISNNGRRGNSNSSTIIDRRMSYSPLWSQSVGLSKSYEKLLCSTENEARRLNGFQLNKVLNSPFELQDVFALLYPHIVYHWKKAANTRKTIEYLLKAGESCIATYLFTEAQEYLEEASNIICNLGKGNDVIAKVIEKDDDVNMDYVKVLKVERRVKAQVESLLGQVFFQKGDRQQALKHFLKALKILKCGLPKHRIFIALRSWRENHAQALHVKYPNRYVGAADSRLANKYIDQVRCLSYIWQILLSLPHIPNRIRLAKLVAMMQVNRSEAADDDLQELITSYTYMMQMHQLTGDLPKAALYEHKATLRCLELPAKLTASDLYITGHLHLVSCVIRFCFGKLTHATTSGYRAYNVADTTQDLSMKLFVLPILAQIHLLSGRGGATWEVLQRLKIIADPENECDGLSYYYSACMDLLLEGGYQQEPFNNCIAYLNQIESCDIGSKDVTRLLLRSIMTLWYSRRQEFDKARSWLSMAEVSLPDFYDNFHSVRAFIRIMESLLIMYRFYIETSGQKHKDTIQLESKCRKDLKKISKLCKKFPVFHPRYMLLKAYYYILTDQRSKAREKITQAATIARYCGNKIDRQYALHSHQLWFSPTTLACHDVEYWERNCERLPDWETASHHEHENRFYSLKIPERGT